MSDLSVPADTAVNLAIISPEGVLFEGEVAEVQVPLEDGFIGIWPGHAPLIAAVSQGIVSYVLKGQTTELAVPGGILRVGVAHCTLLVGMARRLPTSTADKETLFGELSDELERAMDSGQIAALQGER